MAVGASVFLIAQSIGVCLVAVAAAPFIIPFSRRNHQRLVFLLADYNWNTFAWYLTKFAGLQVKFWGDDVQMKIPMYENAFLICNHQCYTDWLVLFIFAGRKGMLGTCKFFIKDMLKYIPGIGWGAWLHGFIILKRNWLKDEKSIASCFTRLKKSRLPFWLISFIEGTRINARKALKAQKYAAAHGFPQFKYCLLPRTKGFVASTIALRNQLDAVYDVTLAYTGHNTKNSITPNFWDVLRGHCTGSIVHMRIRRFTMKTFPTTEPEIATWVFTVWGDKDRWLQRMYDVDDGSGSPREPSAIIQYAHVPMNLALTDHPTE